MEAGFLQQEVLDMDMISFGACLQRVLHRKQEAIMTSVLNQRISQAEGKGFKRWFKSMEKTLRRPKEGPEALREAVASGQFTRKET